MKTRIALLIIAAVWINVTKLYAETALALTVANTYLAFDTGSPTQTTAVTITGLGSNETARGIDVRPATGQVFVSTVTSGSANNSTVHTYTLDPSTGAATLVGSTPSAVPGAGDIATGYDFNPVPDRIRVVNTNDENFRLNPNNATLSGNDTDLTPAGTSTIIGLAYDRSLPGATLTTAYVIDRNDSTVGIIGGVDGSPTPNGGVITDKVDLGFTLSAVNDGGFDISSTGVAYGALTSNATSITSLYTINLTLGGGNATIVGAIGNGATQVISLAILQPDTDGDGLFDPFDNCDSTANADQTDTDADGTGDSCDTDVDGNSILDADTPDTVLTVTPRTSKSNKAKFEFETTVSGSSFECKLDKDGYKSCESPKNYKGLRTGKHNFEVRSLTTKGVVDTTPDTHEWRVKKAGKSKGGKKKKKKKN